MADYITSSELSASLSLTGYTFATADISACITAASRVVDMYTGRNFTTAGSTLTRYYTPESPNILMIDDATSIVSVAIDRNEDGTFEETWATTDYVAEPLNAAADSKPYETLRVRGTGRYTWPRGIEKSVSVSATFGWDAVPTEVKVATTVLASQLLKRSREAPFGIVSFTGSDVAMRIARTDPQVNMLLTDLQRTRPFL